jgi:exosortase A-associated hydrolase 2
MNCIEMRAKLAAVRLQVSQEDSLTMLDRPSLSPEPFFLEGPDSRLFALYFAPPGGQPRGGVLLAPPFAEELNKARRMIALQARSFAAVGWATLVLDLRGTGDSEGDFASASWAGWKADLATGCAWLRGQVAGPLVGWGLRLGCLLLADMASEPDSGFERLLLWQPVLNGATFLGQFLRLRLAADMIRSGMAGETVETLRARLRAGQDVEVTGYGVSPDLAGVIDGMRLTQLTASISMPVHWIEVSPRAAAALTPAAERALEALRLARVPITAEAVSGDPFWSTVEIAVCPALLAPSMGFVQTGGQ